MRCATSVTYARDDSAETADGWALHDDGVQSTEQGWRAVGPSETHDIKLCVCSVLPVSEVGWLIPMGLSGPASNMLGENGQEADDGVDSDSKTFGQRHCYTTSVEDNSK